jgi:hypothetical protein
MLVLAAGCVLQAQAPQKTRASTLVGCLDQDADKFVLREEREMKKIATLEPVGFDITQFARFMGHRVKVEGRMRPNEAVFEVRRIESVADTCESKP